MRYDKYDDVYIIFDLPNSKHCKSSPKKQTNYQISGISEYEYIYEIYGNITEKLNDLDVSYCTTIETDYMLSQDMVNKVAYINTLCGKLKEQSKQVILISLRINEEPNKEWCNSTGWEIHTTHGQTNQDKLAECIYAAANELLSKHGYRIRKEYCDKDADKETNEYIIKNSNCPAVIAYNFYINNIIDVQFLTSDMGKQIITDIYVNGIINYIERFV